MLTGYRCRRAEYVCQPLNETRTAAVVRRATFLTASAARSAYDARNPGEQACRGAPSRSCCAA